MLARTVASPKLAELEAQVAQATAQLQSVTQRIQTLSAENVVVRSGTKYCGTTCETVSSFGLRLRRARNTAALPNSMAIQLSAGEDGDHS